jgi:hypothetical protein
MKFTSTSLATTPDYTTSRTPGKSRPEPSGTKKSVDMRPPKKPKPRSPQTSLPSRGRPEIHETQQFGQQPAVDSKWANVFALYVDAVARSDLGKFPEHVEHTPDELMPQLAKKLADDLLAEKPTAAEAMERVVVALSKGLPLNQVIAILTAEEPRAREVRALSLLLRDVAIGNLDLGKPVDLLSWTQCIGKSTSAQEWMTQLGESLALDCKGDRSLLQRWLSAMTSLADQVQSHAPTASDLVLALLNGFDRACEPKEDLDLNAVPDLDALGEAHMKCERLRAQLTREAEKLVTELAAAVQKASALANEGTAEPAGPGQRKKRIREDPQVTALCRGIVDGIARGVLTLKGVIGALELFSSESETVAALLHALVVQEKNEHGALHALFRNVLDEATRPDELVPHMAPALLEGGGDIGLAAALVERLAAEADGAFTRLLPILGLIEALCLLVEGSRTLSPLNEGVKGMVREAAARLVMEARRCVEGATDRLLEVRQLERTARLTAAQLEELGGELLEGSIEALVRPLGSPVACGYVLEALRSFIDRPACDYLVSLLVRALLERGPVMDVFMGALVNADVPPTANKAHTTLARRVALAFADWVPAGLAFEDLLDGLIGTVGVRSDASTTGFEVLQVMLDGLVSLNKWGSDVKSSLIMRRSEVEKRMMAAKAEPFIVGPIEVIASTRELIFGAKICSLHEDRAELLTNKKINDAVNELVLAVRGSKTSMVGVIKWLSTQEGTKFDWQLLLLKFVDHLFEEPADSVPYGLNTFMHSLFDVDGPSVFSKNVGMVFGMRQESAADRDCMLGAIEALSIQYKNGKLSRLESFAAEYYECTNSEDEQSQKLDALLEKINAKLNEDAPAVEPESAPLPDAGMLPGAFSQALIESNSVSQADPPRNRRFPINVGSGDRGYSEIPLQSEPLIHESFLLSPDGRSTKLIPTTWRPPARIGADDSSEAESESESGLEVDADSALVTAPSINSEGLPVEYSLEPPRGDTVGWIPDSVIHSDGVSFRNETNFVAKDVADLLNKGLNKTVKRKMAAGRWTSLNLAGSDVPMLQRQALITLGAIISDPSVDLRELVLGRVSRGIRNVTKAIGESRHLKVLNLYSFEGHDTDVQGPLKLYNIKHVFEQMTALYPSQSMSLQRLVVSNTTIAEHKAEAELTQLAAAAGGQLNVERRD